VHIMDYALNSIVLCHRQHQAGSETPVNRVLDLLELTRLPHGIRNKRAVGPLKSINVGTYLHQKSLPGLHKIKKMNHHFCTWLPVNEYNCV